MDKTFKIYATVISHKNSDFSGSSDNFYVNGRYKNDYETGNTQVSIESEKDDYIFAICNGMDRMVGEKDTSISMMKELKKFHKHISETGGDLASKFAQMQERVEEVNNVIYSMSLKNEAERQEDTAFAGLFIQDGRAAAANLGKSRVFRLRDQELKLMTGDNKRTERLLKMGIITDEQAKSLSAGSSVPDGKGKSNMQKSEVFELLGGDIFLLCSESVCRLLDEERINEIVSMHTDTGYIANMLVKEALKNGSGVDMTVLVLRVEDLKAEILTGLMKYKPEGRKPSRKTEDDGGNFKTYAASALICILIVGALGFVFFKLFMEGDKDKLAGGPPSNDTNQTVTTTSPSGSTGEDGIDGEQAGESTNTGNNTENPENSSENGGNSNIVTYEVKSGDTLQRISKIHYGTTENYKIIMEANNLTNPNQLQIGQVLKIPKE